MGRYCLVIGGSQVPFAVYIVPLRSCTIRVISALLPISTMGKAH